jgi:hypothetical protein
MGWVGQSGRYLRGGVPGGVAEDRRGTGDTRDSLGINGLVEASVKSEDRGIGTGRKQRTCRKAASMSCTRGSQGKDSAGRKARKR